jgi:coenzyme F420-0:L-glutamate ligase / coenzyme F420-1:gamma-L-glutamate ligase
MIVRNFPSCSLTGISGLPHVQPGDDVAALLARSLQAGGLTLLEGDVLVVAQKIISKAEGRLVNLADVRPGARARELAAVTGKDPRLVELILQESESVSRVRRGVLIVRHRLGFTCANAGIDRSNVRQEGGEETVLLLPEDPDGSARRLRRQLEGLFNISLAVVINDSHGRPFRRGTVGAAIGVSGLPALWDRRGEPDLYGYQLQHTDVALADELAAAAGLLMGQAAEAIPAVLIRGLSLPPGEGQATDLYRSEETDLYR